MSQLALLGVCPSQSQPARLLTCRSLIEFELYVLLNAAGGGGGGESSSGAWRAVAVSPPLTIPSAPRW